MRNTSTIEWELARNKKFNKLYQKFDKESLVKFQNQLLEILIDFDEFCKKNNLNYFLVAGTLIGAKRHDGFIPWDDDIDVVMPRKDYEKLRALKSDDENSKYKFEDSRDTGEISLCGKFKAKDISYYDVLGIGFNKTKKIYIDILPIDQVPNNKILKLIKGTIVNLLRISFSSLRCFKKNDELLNVMSKCSKELKINLFFRKICAIPSLIIGKKRTINLIHKIMITNELKPEELTIALGVKGYFGEVLKVKEVYPLSEIMFENKKFKAPKNPDFYLKNRYGDYMKIPSESEQMERLVRLKENWKEIL